MRVQKLAGAPAPVRYITISSTLEGFFGRLKNEFFYNHDFRGCTPEQFMKRLGAWIEWYNNVRIKESLGFMSPVDYRTEESRRALLAA